MRILREDTIPDLEFNTLSDLFTYYIEQTREQKQNNSDSAFGNSTDKDKFDWVKRKIKELKKFNNLENTIVQLFSNLESEAIGYLNDINFDIKGSRENIEYVIDKILSNEIDLKNKSLYRFITTCKDLYENTAQDFNYIFFIGQIFSDKSKLKDYFNEVNDLSIESLFDKTNKLKSAAEIYEMIEDLTEERGKKANSRNKTKDKKSITIEEFMRNNNKSGNHSDMLETLSILIQKNWNSLNKKFGSFDVYKTAIENLNNKTADELFSKKFNNDGTILTFVQDFVSTLDEYIQRNITFSKA